MWPPDGHPHRPLHCLLKEGRIKRNKEKSVRVWKSKTQDGSTVCRKPAGRRRLSWSSSVPGHVRLRGASYGWAKGFCIFVCVHFLRGGLDSQVRVLFLFFFDRAQPSSILKEKKKELVQFESLYGVRASGPIWNNEGWLSRCVDLGYVQGWRSSAESKCGWMWPGCSSYVGLNCIKMCGVRVQGSKRGAERLTSFLSCQRLIYVLHRATPRLS